MIVAINNALKMTPSVRLNLPSMTNSANRATEMVDSGACRRMTDGVRFTAVMRPALPRIRVRLATLDPTIFPTPRAGFPRHAAIVDTTSSGAEVPKPRTTAPITTELRLRARAREAAPSTSQFPDLQRRANPMMSRSAALNTRPLMIVSWWTECASSVLVFHGRFEHHSLVELRDHTPLYLLPGSMAVREQEPTRVFEALPTLNQFTF